MPYRGELLRGFRGRERVRIDALQRFRVPTTLVGRRTTRMLETIGRRSGVNVT